MQHLLAAGVALLFAAASLAQPVAHEHGAAELRVALDGARVVIEFASPLDNLAGFEHAPKTAAQRQALERAEQRLRAFDGLFVLPAAAGCTLKSVEIDSPYPATGATSHAAQDSEHAELHAIYELDCTAPAALTELRVRLVEAFPRIERIRAQAATPSGQRAVTLDRKRSVLPL